MASNKNPSATVDDDLLSKRRRYVGNNNFWCFVNRNGRFSPPHCCARVIEAWVELIEPGERKKRWKSFRERNLL